MGIFNKYYKNGALIKEEIKKKAQEVVAKKVKKKCANCSSR